MAMIKRQTILLNILDYCCVSSTWFYITKPLQYKTS